jgi:hypothetical protein
VSVVERDLGWQRIKKELRVAQRSSVKVGIQQGQKRSGGIDQAGIARVHEYGHLEKGIPERSFMRSSFAENRTTLESELAAQYVAITEGRTTTHRALEVVGMLHESQVKAKIRSNIPPPLKPATVERKGSSVALIDTKQLHDGIRYKLDTGGKR